MRPRAIVTYERLYWAAYALLFVGTATSWQAGQAALAANPMVSDMAWVMPMTQVLRIAIAVLLWYFTARVPNVVTKWIVVVFAALGAIGVLLGGFGLLTGTTPAPLGTVLGIAANIVYAVAASLLFKPEARAWFGEDRDDDSGVTA